MGLWETVTRAELLRAEVDRFMRNVRPEFAPEHPLHSVDRGYDAILRGFFAHLLIDSPFADPESVWPLLEARVRAELLNDPQIQQEKQFLSQPLVGTPAELLMRIKLCNEKSAWAEVHRAVRASLTEEQRGVLFLVETALMV
jgi:hypothetical protein